MALDFGIPAKMTAHIAIMRIADPAARETEKQQDQMALIGLRRDGLPGVRQQRKTQVRQVAGNFRQLPELFPVAPAQRRHQGRAQQGAVKFQKACPHPSAAHLSYFDAMKITASLMQSARR
jgi:hypothetical protein